MTINMDDVNYAYMSLFMSKDGKKYKSQTNQEVNWFLRAFSIFCLKSRCLDFESFYDASIGSYYSFSISSLQDEYEHNWPEMEERIRRNSHEKYWYEKRTGMRI